MHKYLLAAAALALTLGGLTAGPVAAQDAAAGEKVFKKCAACHQIGPDAKNRVGPALTGVIGRTAGTAPDFKYSDAMKAAGEGGLVWNDETLNEYLTNPKTFVPGNKMTFVGLKDEADRANVIAYIEANGGAS